MTSSLAGLVPHKPRQTLQPFTSGCYMDYCSWNGALCLGVWFLVPASLVEEEVAAPAPLPQPTSLGNRPIPLMASPFLVVIAFYFPVLSWKSLFGVVFSLFWVYSPPQILFSIWFWEEIHDILCYSTTILQPWIWNFFPVKPQVAVEAYSKLSYHQIT